MKSEAERNTDWIDSLIRVAVGKMCSPGKCVLPKGHTGEHMQACGVRWSVNTEGRSVLVEYAEPLEVQR